MGISFNPLIFSGLVNIPAAGAVTWRGSVPTEGDLPSAGNTLGDAIAVQDSGKIYVWSGAPAKWHDTGITTAVFGNTPNENGASIVTDDTNPLIRKDTLVLQPADATHPGGVSTAAQTFAGDKTFQNEVIVQGSIDAQAGIDSSTGTLDIGATATTINIGAAGATITIQGDTTYEHVTNLYVKDKTITLNDGGAAGSAGGAGIEIEEDVLGTQQITGYAQVSSDRDAWELKAPNQAGVAVIDAGAAGITINQSSHDPVTLGVVGSIPNLNGATLTNQVLNLEPADSTNPGVVTTTTQTFAGEKTFEDDVIVEGEIDAQLGINSSTSSLDIGLTTDTVNIGKSTGTTDIVGTVTIEYNPADPTDWAPAPTHVIEAIDQLADRFVEQDEVTNEPTGFVNRTSSELVFTDGGLIPRNFEIKVKAPATSFTFYVKGKKFTKSTTESIQISADLGDHYIYYDNNGVLQETIDPDEIKIIIQERAFVAVVYWNNETNSHTYFADERHGLTMDGVTHAYLHTVFGSRYLSGFGLDNFNLLAPSFQADIGSFRDEDILHQVTTQIDEIPILYRFGANNGWRKKAADIYPVIYQGSTADYPAGIIRLPYNEYTGAAWQLTEIDNNKYVLVHFFATNDIDNPIVGIQGTAPHESISDAKNAANTEITQLSGLPFTEFVPIGSVVFQSSVVSKASPTYSDIQLIDGANYIDFRGTQLYTPAGTATTHGLLSGLGNDDHLQYLLADGTRAMGGPLSMGTHQINDVVDPLLAQDAATKNYVDGLTVPEGQRKHVNYANGSDVTGNGSILKPWKTVSYACSQITDSSPVTTTGTWAAGSNIITVTSTAGIVVGQNIFHSSTPVVGFATGGVVVTQILSPTTIQIFPVTTAARPTALSLSFRKPYVIEFDGIGVYDTVTLPPFVSVVGKSMSTSVIGTINCTHPAIDLSIHTIMNAEIRAYNLDSSLLTTGQSTRFFDCRIFDLNCVGKAISNNQTLLYSTDVVNQLHFKGGYLLISGSNYLQRVRIFHNSNGGSVNYALIQGGQYGSTAGTWLSGNAFLDVIGGVPMSVPIVTWGEVSANTFSGRVYPFVPPASNTWTTDVTISIQNSATQVILTGDGVKTINTLISDWNAANPTNLMTLVEGNGAQVVPTGAEIVFKSGARPFVSFDSTSYVTEAASIQGPVGVLPNARPEGIRYDDRARASYYGFRFYATNYGTIGNSISLVFDGIKTVQQVVSAWNSANPSNTVTYTSAGSADARGYGVIPLAATIFLSGGGLFTGTSSTFNLRDAIVQLGQSAQASVLKTELGIMQTTVVGEDNKSTPVNIAELSFSNATNRAFDAIVSIVRGSNYAEYSLKAIQKASSWEMSQDYIGDDTGIVFNILPSGQVQYTSTATGFAPTFSFRAFRV